MSSKKAVGINLEMHDPVVQVKNTDMEMEGSLYIQKEKLIPQNSEYYFLNSQYF